MFRTFCLLILIALQVCVAETLRVIRLEPVKQYFPGVLTKTERLLKSEGYEVEWLDVPERRAIIMLDQGTADLDPFRFIGFEQISKSSMRLNPPIFTSRFVLISHKNQPINDLDQLKGLTASAVNGLELLEELSSEFGSQFIRAPSIESGIKMVVFRRTDYMLIPETVLNENADIQSEDLHVVYDPIPPLKAHFWISNNQEKHKEVLESALSRFQSQD